MSKTKKTSALLRAFIVLSVVVLAAFTTNGAWASTPSAADPSGKKPTTNPQTDPQLQACLANGVHSALYLRCVANGTIQSNSSALSKGTNSTSKNKTTTLNTNRNSSSSSSNTNNTNQQLIKIGKVTPPTSKGSTQQSNNNNSTKLTTTTKDPSKLNSSKASDPPSSSLTSNQSSLVKAFEKLTGHNLTNAQTQKLLSVKGSSNSGNQSQFIHQLENVTGHQISNTQVATLEKPASDPPATQSDPPSSLTKRLENITGHTISTSQLDKLIAESVSGTLNSEGETKLLQTIESITGNEITAAEAQRVERALGGDVDQSIGSGSGEGSESVSVKQEVESIAGVTLSTAQFNQLLAESVSSSRNSEGETKLLQTLESLTGNEITAAEAQEIENTLGGDVSESIHHVTSTEESESNNSENETSLLQQVENITGHEISTSQLNTLIDESGSSSLNSEGETALLQELESITGQEISPSEAQEVEDALGGGVSQAIESENEPVAIGSVIPNTGLVVTNVFGEVSSLTDTNGVSNFLIGNTTVQLSDSLKGSNNFNNGDFVSVNGRFSSTNVFVGNALVTWVKPPFTVISGTVSSMGIINSINETAVPGVVSFMIGNTTIKMSSSIEATDNIKNGDTIKLEGFFVNPQNQVVSNSFEYIVGSIKTWTPAQ
jgi:uncharacterized protein (DUF697 family)